MPQEFPFLPEEWQEVNEAASEIVEASAMGDELLQTIKLDAMLDILATLREKYGDHPVLLETEADFIHDYFRRVDLYLSAIEESVRQNFPNYTIRISLARCLLEYESDHRPENDEDQKESAAMAIEHLRACETEVMSIADEHDLNEWRRLVSACKALG